MCINLNWKIQSKFVFNYYPLKSKKNNGTNYANGSAYVKNPAEPNRLSVGFPMKVLGITLFTQWGNYDVYETGK